MNIGVGS